MGQGSPIVFEFTQVACTDVIYPQSPDDRPIALIVSLCLPDGHQKAENTTKLKGHIYLENKPFCEIDRKCSVMMQTDFGHPPIDDGTSMSKLDASPLVGSEFVGMAAKWFGAKVC